MPARSGRRGEQGILVVLVRLPEPHVPQPLLVQVLEDDEEDRGHYGGIVI